MGTDPILDALARLEERVVERLGERIESWHRELRLFLDSHFDALIQRLDRILAHSNRTRVDPDLPSQS